MRPNYVGFEPYRPRGECSPCREVIELVQAAAAALRLWLRRARERRDLARLDAQALRDIGMTPSEAAREMQKPFWSE